MILGNEFYLAVYLSFHWFNDSWTCNSWIRTCNSQTWIRNSWIWTRNSWIWARNSWIWTRTFEFHLVHLSFQLVTHNSCFTISQIDFLFSIVLTLVQFLVACSSNFVNFEWFCHTRSEFREFELFLWLNRHTSNHRLQPLSL